MPQETSTGVAPSLVLNGTDRDESHPALERPFELGEPFVDRAVKRIEREPKELQVEFLRGLLPRRDVCRELPVKQHDTIALPPRHAERDVDYALARVGDEGNLGWVGGDQGRQIAAHLLESGRPAHEARHPAARIVPGDLAHPLAHGRRERRDRGVRKIGPPLEVGKEGAITELGFHHRAHLSTNRKS